jgi:hypothetical protein
LATTKFELAGASLHGRYVVATIRSGATVSVAQPEFAANKDRSPTRRFLPVILTVPLLATSVGVDGSEMFQILATENLHLSPRAIGLAFGLGVVSVPFQLLAARIPLWRARRNLRLFLLVMATLAVALGVLVLAKVTGTAASTALLITVVAEIAVSVLYATSLQPLLSFGLRTEQRQQLGRIARPIGSVLITVVVLGFGSAGASMRGVMLLAIAAVGVAAATSLRHIAVPPPPAPLATDVVAPPTKDQSAAASDPASDGADANGADTAVRRLYVFSACLGLGSVPLFVVYVHAVLWPSANLGMIAALQVIAGLAASIASRPTVEGLRRRARLAATGLVLCAALLLTVATPVQSVVGKTIVLMVTVGTAFGLTMARIALLELVHQHVDEANSVRAFTVLDVVASSSVQLGLLVGGFLVAASTATSWPVDPYRVFVLVCLVATAATTTRLTAPARPASL